MLALPHSLPLPSQTYVEHSVHCTYKCLDSFDSFNIHMTKYLYICTLWSVLLLLLSVVSLHLRCTNNMKDTQKTHTLTHTLMIYGNGWKHTLQNERQRVPNVALRFQPTDGSIDPSIHRSYDRFVSFWKNRPIARCTPRAQDTARGGGGETAVGSTGFTIYDLRFTLYDLRSLRALSAGYWICREEQVRKKHENETETGTKWNETLPKIVGWHVW